MSDPDVSLLIERRWLQYAHKRDVIEAQFETLPTAMQPSREMFELSHEMFRDL